MKYTLYFLMACFSISICHGQTRIEYFQSGIAKSKKQDYAGAIRDFDKAIEMDPKDPAALNNRGIAKLKLEDYKAAIEDFTLALEITPRDETVLRNRGKARILNNQKESGCQDLKKALALGDTRASENILKYCN